MNRELETLIKAYDALIEASEEHIQDRQAIFDSRLDDSLQRYPNLSRDGLIKLVKFQHRRTERAQRKPSSLPPKA
jgi:hypothetical protein